MRAAELARRHTEKAIEVMAEVMQDPFAENRDRLKAANDLLDRGHGKAAQAVIAVPPSKALRALAAAMSDQELRQIINQPLPRLRHESEDAIEAEFSEKDPLLT